MKSRQTFVVVLRSEAHAVVVIPESALRLIDVAIGLVTGAEAGQRVGIVLVVILAGGEVVARETVAFRWSMPAVQVGGNRVDAESAVVRWQIVDVAHQRRNSVHGNESRAGTHAVESPNGLQRQLVRHAGLGLPLDHLVNRRRGEGKTHCGRLMRARAAFVCHAGGRIHRGIGIDGRRGAERGDAGLLLGGHYGHG